MKKKIKQFCSYCGSSLINKKIDNQYRNYCQKCDNIFYENPLPVVSSISLNRKRDILLVLRDRNPHSGKWCLPSGFVELNESTENAVLRELKEETGLSGKISRLIDTYSKHNREYGDLIWITYEIKKISGEINPGDDARDAKYFPINKLPKMAFEANVRAVKQFKKIYKNLWDLEDSFKNKSDNLKELNIPTKSLYKIISKDSKIITDNWVSDVMTNKTTIKYSTYQRDILFDRAYTVISQFGNWMTKPKSEMQNIWNYYNSIGDKRYIQGFKLSEVLSALSLTRKHIFTHVLANKKVWKKSLAMYQVLEFMWQVNFFFDKASYYITLGYEQHLKDT